MTSIFKSKFLKLWYSCKAGSAFDLPLAAELLTMQREVDGLEASRSFSRSRHRKPSPCDEIHCLILVRRYNRGHPTGSTHAQYHHGSPRTFEPSHNFRASARQCDTALAALGGPPTLKLFRSFKFRWAARNFEYSRHHLIRGGLLNHVSVSSNSVQPTLRDFGMQPG
jgi:hypothetical protein